MRSRSEEIAPILAVRSLLIPAIMKTVLYATCAIALLITGIGCTTQGTGGGATGATARAAVVTVQYVNPGNFTDFSIHNRDVQYSASVFTNEVTRTLEPVMRSRFPGDALTLRFTNIDLAGRRTTGPGPTRIVRTRTPARLRFDYVLQEQSGRSVASGSRSLVDTSPPGSASRSGTLTAETRMLQRWLRGLSVNR